MARSQSFVLVLLSVLSASGSSSANDADNSTGFGYELLMAKLDYLEYKFLEVQVEAKEQVELLLQNQNVVKRDLLERISEVSDQQKALVNHEKIMSAIFELNPRKHPSDNKKLLQGEGGRNSSASPIRSCLEEESKMSGRYWLQPSNGCTAFEVYCEQQFYGGGWVMIQNRFNGSTDFYRNWTDYKTGFGELDGEFWLGLDKIYQLTSSRTHELLVHLEDYEGVVKYARYAAFAIGSEGEDYVLRTVDGYTGTAGDSLASHKGMKYSTADRDNDTYDQSCAANYHAAWWYNKCYASNLNGPYKNVEDTDANTWHSFHSKYRGLKASKMMIRQI